MDPNSWLPKTTILTMIKSRTYQKEVLYTHLQGSEETPRNSGAASKEA